MFRISLACCAATFGSADVTLCGISIGGGEPEPFEIGAGDALVGAAGGTPFVAREEVSTYIVEQIFRTSRNRMMLGVIINCIELLLFAKSCYVHRWIVGARTW
jgi:hypothetical protein